MRWAGRRTTRGVFSTRAHLRVQLWRSRTVRILVGGQRHEPVLDALDVVLELRVALANGFAVLVAQQACYLVPPGVDLVVELREGFLEAPVILLAASGPRVTRAARAKIGVRSTLLRPQKCMARPARPPGADSHLHFTERSTPSCVTSITVALERVPDPFESSAAPLPMGWATKIPIRIATEQGPAASLKLSACGFRGRKGKG
mmetsp:Transcript_11640/g.36884  ORF Transcript_11640/g.36884 Transcript_11640/m.36884 type:complete len:203 (+) Transcript_11640:1043-1651(+)